MSDNGDLPPSREPSPTPSSQPDSTSDEESDILNINRYFRDEDLVKSSDCSHLIRRVRRIYDLTISDRFINRHQADFKRKQKTFLHVLERVLPGYHRKFYTRTIKEIYRKQTVGGGSDYALSSVENLLLGTYEISSSSEESGESDFSFTNETLDVELTEGDSNSKSDNTLLASTPIEGPLPYQSEEVDLVALQEGIQSIQSAFAGYEIKLDMLSTRQDHGVKQLKNEMTKSFETIVKQIEAIREDLRKSDQYGKAKEAEVKERDDLIREMREHSRKVLDSLAKVQTNSEDMESRFTTAQKDWESRSESMQNRLTTVQKDWESRFATVQTDLETEQKAKEDSLVRVRALEEEMRETTLMVKLHKDAADENDALLALSLMEQQLALEETNKVVERLMQRAPAFNRESSNTARDDICEILGLNRVGFSYIKTVQQFDHYRHSYFEQSKMFYVNSRDNTRQPHQFKTLDDFIDHVWGKFISHISTSSVYEEREYKAMVCDRDGRTEEEHLAYLAKCKSVIFSSTSKTREDGNENTHSLADVKTMLDSAQLAPDDERPCVVKMVNGVLKYRSHDDRTELVRKANVEIMEAKAKFLTAQQETNNALGDLNALIATTKPPRNEQVANAIARTDTQVQPGQRKGKGQKGGKK